MLNEQAIDVIDPQAKHMDIISALDKLNSWVRSESYRDGVYGGARNMVYHMKHHVLWRCDLPMLHRGIDVAITCRDCGGKGRYVDSDGQRFDHCYACNSSGTARLRFIETKFENGITWHTPSNKFPRYWEGGYQIEMNYAPNQRGKDLEPWEAAALLNLTEPCFPHPHDYYTDWSSTAFNHFRYSLYVGATDKVCSLCGSPTIRTIGYSVTRDHVCWRDHACQKCDEIYDANQGAAIFKAFPIPQRLVNHPEIQRWMQRHN